ncbi:MAG: ABC transporter permease [Planctomycetes bacterium]|nr:ABC transporter permease [Planctomycetota bacterium]
MSFISNVGRTVLRPTVEAAGKSVSLALQTLAVLPQTPRRLRSTLEQMYLIGVKTLHVVLMVGFFIGMIVALQVGLQLATFSQQESIGLIVAPMMALEMAPLITAILLAASVGSAMAAELGTMKVQEELTALDVLSVNAVSYLVLPRVLALTIMSPLLSAMVAWVGTLGGGIVAVSQLGISFEGYVHNSMDSMRVMREIVPIPKYLYDGLLKAMIFGFVTAIVGCASGMAAANGAKGVGQTTRSAVRNAIILIIVLDFYLGKALM